MGNNNPKQSVVNSYSAESNHRPKQVKFQEINTNSTSSLFAKSFTSLNSQQSVYSISRPWSRVSRRRWRESTLTLPYESSKTAWPVSQLESYFLPVFPVNASSHERKYDVIEEVANGAFGKVFKVYDKEDRRFYALKVLSKSKIITENAVQQVKEEVQIQSVCGHHNFIVNSPCHWQTRKKLFIVSDFVDGGELHRLLETYKVLPLILVRLYVAQIALILDFLHNAGIIYRDLKPENILLNGRGDIQIVDFGLSKWLSYGHKTKTLCGTLRYMAPEVVGLQPYGHACDWWSLGIIACRMLTGEFPTLAVPNSNEGATSKKALRLPDTATSDAAARDLLLRLLEIDPGQRLHSLRTLQTIAFYKGYNFDDVKKKKVIPNDVLWEHFPDGPPMQEDDFHVEGFDDVCGEEV